MPIITGYSRVYSIHLIFHSVHLASGIQQEPLDGVTQLNCGRIFEEMYSTDLVDVRDHFLSVFSLLKSCQNGYF